MSTQVSVSVVVSTYNQPGLLERSLFSLGLQRYPSLEIIVADDGSGDATAAVVRASADQSRHPVRHVWQRDDGFRKTQVLNKAILAAKGEYLVFTDGDCVLHPEFVAEHVLGAAPGRYLNGSIIRLSAALSNRITREAVADGRAFDMPWLMRNGGGLNRRFLRFGLPRGARVRLNALPRKWLYWLGSNSSCFRADAVAVNGFDNRFSYGFEDVDFGHRLENFGLVARTVRWTATALHLWHDKPWAREEEIEHNRRLLTPREPGGRHRAEHGLDELRG